MLDEPIYCKTHTQTLKIKICFYFGTLRSFACLLEDGLKCGQRTCSSPVDLKINPLYLWESFRLVTMKRLVLVCHE